MTHTQHGILDEEVANLAQSMGSPIDVNTPQPTIKDLTPQPINGDRTTSGGHVTSSQTMINIDKGESAVTVAIHSKPKQLCSFMPGKCNCSSILIIVCDDATCPPLVVLSPLISCGVNSLIVGFSVFTSIADGLTC
eukprot:145368_1